MKTYTIPEDIKMLEEEIEQVKKEKNKAIENQDFENAANLRDLEIEKRNLLSEKQKNGKMRI